ncbi:MAG: type II secretion system protein GspG [Candidatus Hydrogenedentota bacterium]
MIDRSERLKLMRDDSHGFTLIELMLVTVIIGILAGMVVVVFAGNATSARIKAALGDISSYESALELYALDNNDQYPTSLNQLVSGKKKYLRDLNTDPWGNPYIYEKPGRKHPESFDLYSGGARWAKRQRGRRGPVVEKPGVGSGEKRIP